MSPMLRRRSSEIVLALLCVLVLTRMPLVCFAEASSPASVTIEDCVALDADVASRVVEIPRPALPAVFTRHVNTDSRVLRLIEYAVLRL
jgi:hypothetical protein